MRNYAVVVNVEGGEDIHTTRVYDLGTDLRKAEDQLFAIAEATKEEIADEFDFDVDELSSEVDGREGPISIYHHDELVYIIDFIQGANKIKL
jgi:hypothetical protein